MIQWFSPFSYCELQQFCSPKIYGQGYCLGTDIVDTQTHKARTMPQILAFCVFFKYHLQVIYGNALNLHTLFDKILVLL